MHSDLFPGGLLSERMHPSLASTCKTPSTLHLMTTKLNQLRESVTKVLLETIMTVEMGVCTKRYVEADDGSGP